MSSAAISADISSLRHTYLIIIMLGSTMWRKSMGLALWFAIMRELKARRGFWGESMVMRRSATWPWSAKMRMSAAAPLCAAMKLSAATWHSRWSRRGRPFGHLLLRSGLFARRFRSRRRGAVGWGGCLQFQNNGTAVLIGAVAPASCVGNTIGGNLTIQNNTAPGGAVGNTVGNNLTVQNNTAATIVNGNTVTGNLQDQNNTAPTQVFTNVVGNDLQCQQDSSITGGGNTARQKQGQCITF